MQLSENVGRKVPQLNSLERDHRWVLLSSSRKVTN